MADKGALEIDNSVPVLDLEAALDRLDNDKELYSELVGLYLEDTPKQIEILFDVLKSGDSAVVERQAHSIKSASANLGLERLRSIAAEMEEAGREGELAWAREQVSVFEQEYLRAEEALGQIS